MSIKKSIKELLLFHSDGIFKHMKSFAEQKSIRSPAIQSSGINEYPKLTTVVDK